jgi:WD repeat-containing protein 48
MLLIEEEAEPGYTTAYRGTVGSTAADVHALEEAMPLWLVEYLLLHRMPSSPPQIKLSFVLLPWSGGKEGDGELLPELLNTCVVFNLISSALLTPCSTQSKLTASRFLRVRKLTLHVCFLVPSS